MARSVTDATFDTEVLKATAPIVVDFWAPWCGPCRMIGPIVDQLSAEYEGQVEFVKLNVDENPETSMHYKVHSIPTLLVFKDGKPVERIVGALPKGEIQKHVNAVLK